MTAAARQSTAQSAIIPSILSGLLLGLLEIIVAVSFANLIFSGEAAEYLPYGIGLTLIGGVMMMGVTALLSSAPGIVSTVQDSPGVILAAVAGALIAANAEPLLPTLLATISLTAIVTGLLLLVLGYYRLGEIVRYIPYPVVGGFLAGTGLLLLIGGIGSMTTHSLTLANLPLLLAPDALIQWLPGLLFALVLFFGLRWIKHFLALPLLMVGSILAFYAVLLITGTSLTEATAAGHLLGDMGSQAILQPPLLQGFQGVNWPAVILQSGSIAIIAMLVLVSLLLNSSAIELILDTEVDLNRELLAAGGANLLSGLAGGLGGFHTPSFTSLNRRMGAQGRLAPLIGAGLCGLMLLIGADVLALIPKAILGGLLVFLGLDFLNDWVVQGWRKFSRMDYAIILLIMLAITFIGFLIGVVLGLLAMVIQFAVQNSRVDVVRSALSGADIRSHVERNSMECRLLAVHDQEIFILELRGFIFFGTAHKLQRAFQARVTDPDQPKVRYAILNFQRITGLDSSGTQIFKKIGAMAELHGFTLILAHLTDETRRQLALETSPHIKEFSNLDLALQWCEDELIAEAVHAQPATPSRDQLSTVGMEPGIAQAVVRYFDRVTFAAGESLIQQGDPAHELFFIQEGEVATYLKRRTGEPIRVSVMGSGTVVGEIALYLNQTRTASVIAESPTIAYRVTDESLQQMKEQDPKLAATFNEFMLQILAQRVIIASQRLANIEE